MLIATIGTLTYAMASSAPVWIAGWTIVLVLIIGVPVYYTRRRRNAAHRPPQ